MDIALFRQHFPEFSDTLKYPDDQIDFWAGAAEIMIIQRRWGPMYSRGIELYVAHYLTLAARNAQVAAGGGNPGLGGGATGAVSSKTVGDVSISYDTSSGIDESAGQWGLTTYGQLLWNLILLFGAGAIQL